MRSVPIQFGVVELFKTNIVGRRKGEQLELTKSMFHAVYNTVEFLFFYLLSLRFPGCYYLHAVQMAPLLIRWFVTKVRHFLSETKGQFLVKLLSICCYSQFSLYLVLG